MNTQSLRVFSRLHQKAITEARLALVLGQRLRKRIWLLLKDYNESVSVQPDPNDNWRGISDIVTEVTASIYRLYGIERLEIDHGDGAKTIPPNLKVFFFSCHPENAFDIVQLWYDWLPPDRQSSLQRALNEIFEEEGCPWCFCERSFFQVDSKFLEERILAQTHELLSAQGFWGAAQEFVEARNDFASGDFKGTIHNSCKAYESAMKAILKKDSGAADDLIRALGKSGILDDLPKHLRSPFEKKVLQAVPFLRNELAGHGQGQQVIDVSRELAELCLHLSGAFILYCARRQLLLNLPPATPTANEISDDNLPF